MSSLSAILLNPVAITVTVMLCVALVFGAVISFRSAVDVPERTYMDPLGWPIRLVWPLVLFVAHYFSRYLSADALTRMRTRLQKAGLGWRLSPEQFFALRVVSSVLMAIGAWLLLMIMARLLAVDLVSVPLLLAVAAFGYFMPALKLQEKRKQREKAIVRMLPTYLDFITMGVEAGLSLPGALVQATRNGPDGLLKQELQWVNRDIKAGAGRIEALQAMATRLDLREVTGVVSALAQAEKTGASIGATLRVQADQQRIDRFQRAEKLAMEAPVKLIFPLVAFIFPVTFIVIGFPIVMKFLHGV